jgi:hypothetical protein
LNLYNPSRHETLSTGTWCEDLAHNEIKTIVDDIATAGNSDGSWPLHPLDAESYPTPEPKWALYAGAAGVVVALNILRNYGYSAPDLNHLLPSIHANYLKNPDVQLEPGLHIGEIGILLPAVLSQPDNHALSNRLQECMATTLKLPYYDITSGQSGMMHAALVLYRKTRMQCWKNLYVQGAESLLANWQQDPDSGQWLWMSEVFGQHRQYYGACHGVAGNANILVQGVELLNEDLTELIIDRAVSTLNRAAITEGGLTNWFNYCNPKDDKRLVQWCHGAAGIVTAMAAMPMNNSSHRHLLDQLLKAAGELVWQAGPLKKGAGLCHGTAGNAYAFLYLHKRWGDPMWLERARQFGVHAIGQCQADRLRFGYGRYSLWTGDAGLAVFLHHCLNPQLTALPGLELFS